jgi:hypothetical protein
VQYGSSSLETSRPGAVSGFGAGVVKVAAASAGKFGPVGAAARRQPQRDARVHAELACLVRRGRDHRPLGRVAASADDHGLSGQRRVPQHLDRGDELVEVDVEHPSRHMTII